MAKTIRRQIAIPLLFVLILPLTAALCCCVGEAVATSASAHSHHHGEADHPHADHHHGKSGSSHNHGECNHNQLLSPFVIGQGLQLFKLASQIFKFQEKPLCLLKEGFDIAFPLSTSPPLETGPPGAALSATPLYLEISVLRI